VSQILPVAQSGTAAPVRAAITATFVTVPWCRDEGTMVVETVSVPLNLVSCQPAPGGKVIGQFHLTTSLVRTTGEPNVASIIEDIVGNDTARFAVFPHGKHKGLLSVGLVLNLPKLAMDKPKLLAMPVLKRGGYDGQVVYSFTIDIMNDTAKLAKIYLTDVSAGSDLPADEAILTIPPGGMDTVTLDTGSQVRFAANGWVSFASILTK
jgi:hypothetical protein